MKFWLWLSVTALLVLGTQAVFEKHTFYSNSLKENRNVYVYTPLGYTPSKTFPVTYFLQGTGNFSEYEEMLPSINAFLDFNILMRRINATYVVLPDGISGVKWPAVATEWTNSKLLGHWEDYFIKDVINFTETNIPNVQKYRGGRFLLGISMGGFAAMKFAMSYPDAFGGVASLSGFMDIDPLIDIWNPTIQKEQKKSPGPNDTYNPLAGRFSQLLYSLAACWSPVIGCDDGSLPIDLPFVEGTYEYRLPVLYEWISISVMGVLRENAEEVKKHNLAIYFDVGDKDDYHFYASNAPFQQALDLYGIPHTYELFDGKHMNKLQERLPIGAKFLSRHFNATDKVEGNLNRTPAATGRSCSTPLSTLTPTPNFFTLSPTPTPTP